ncbi:hypothetical protein [Pseudomonas sp. NFX1]|uniref:hypothetical protein n=1 Tax=Pseudomonas sp. NFX1 TaxID=2201355 RepID=UPI003DA71735
MNIVTKPIKSADENICGAEFSVVGNGSNLDYGTASQELTFNAFSGDDSGSSASGVFVFASDTANATIQLDYKLAAQFSVREFKQATIKKPDPESGETSSEIVYQDNVNVSLVVIRDSEVLFSKGYNLKEEDAEGNWVNTSESGVYSGGGFSISMPAVMGAPYVAALQRLDIHSAAIRITASKSSITASVKLLFPLEDKSGGFTTREQEAIEKSLKVFEGNTDFLYLDSEGKVTVGVGFMLPDESSALALPFLDFDDNPASDEQKREEWRTVHALATGHSAGWYEDSTNLYLSDDFIESHLQSLVAESFNELTRIYPDFGKYPSAARVALQDMIYNLGMTKLNENFPNLNAAVKRQDWVTAAAESHRKGPNEDRNNAVRDLFLKAAGSGL